MARLFAGSLLALLAAAWALPLEEAVPSSRIPDAALEVSDDECVAEDDGQACALNALQHRAQKVATEAPVAAKPATPEAVPEATPDEVAPFAFDLHDATAFMGDFEDIEPVERNLSLLSDEGPAADVKCFAFTGGTCATGSCKAERRSQCVDRKCVCTGCAGADGKCYNKKNRLIAKDFVLRNKKYSHHKMYFQRISTFGQMKTTRASSWMNMEQDKFNLYQVPGRSSKGYPLYFLSSTKWENYVVGMKPTTGTAFSPFGAYAVKLAKKAGLFDMWGPKNIMLRICQYPKLSKYAGGIQLGSIFASTVWGYVHHGSSYVYGSMTSPGRGGVWMPDPPIPHGSLPTCPR